MEQKKLFDIIAISAAILILLGMVGIFLDTYLGFAGNTALDL